MSHILGVLNCKWRNFTAATAFEIQLRFEGGICAEIANINSLYFPARNAPYASRSASLSPASLEAKVGGRGSLAAGYSAHKKAQSRPGFGLLRASVLTSNREEKQLVL